MGQPLRSNPIRRSRLPARSASARAAMVSVSFRNPAEPAIRVRATGEAPIVTDTLGRATLDSVLAMALWIGAYPRCGVIFMVR